jgi:hypothetical protein
MKATDVLVDAALGRYGRWAFASSYSAADVTR